MKRLTLVLRGHRAFCIKGNMVYWKPLYYMIIGIKCLTVLANQFCCADRKIYGLHKKMILSCNLHTSTLIHHPLETMLSPKPWHYAVCGIRGFRSLYNSGLEYCMPEYFQGIDCNMHIFSSSGSIFPQERPETTWFKVQHSSTTATI